MVPIEIGELTAVEYKCVFARPIHGAVSLTSANHGFRVSALLS